MTDVVGLRTWSRWSAAPVLVAIVGIATLFWSHIDQTAVLNGLRAEINATYGKMGATPRINCGPCTRFALAFRAQWKARFGDELTLVCVMSPDKFECGHVALKLPDGSYFDGGNGVMTPQQLMDLFQGCPIEEMAPFDLDRLDRLVGGLHHDRYLKYPNYSDELTASIIGKHLDRLPGG